MLASANHFRCKMQMNLSLRASAISLSHSVLRREIVYVQTSKDTVMKECDDSDRGMCTKASAELLLLLQRRIH